MSGGAKSADVFMDSFMIAYLSYHLPTHLLIHHPTGIKFQLNLELLHRPLDPPSASQRFG